jgi:hypothetical protein
MLQVFLLSDTVMQEFQVRWPFRGIRLNCQDRTELPTVLNDIAAIWTAALTDDLEIKRSEFKVKWSLDINPVLIIYLDDGSSARCS